MFNNQLWVLNISKYDYELFQIEKKIDEGIEEIINPTNQLS